jgi:hypothetical protein
LKIKENKMKNENIKIGLVLGSFLLSSVSFAGNEAHGGNVVGCSGQTPVVLDYYNATLPTVGGTGDPALVDISNMTEDEVVNLFKQRFNIFPEFEIQFQQALEIIGPIHSWISANLTNAGDANDPYNLPTTCTLQQAAIRQGITIFGDPAVIHSLSPAQQGVLRVHEALYYIGDITIGLETSENIRAVIRDNLEIGNTVEKIRTDLYRIGGKVTPWQDLVNGNGNIYKEQSGSISAHLSITYDPSTASLKVCTISSSITLGIYPGMCRVLHLNMEDVTMANSDARPYPGKGFLSTITDQTKISWDGTTITWVLTLKDCENASTYTNCSLNYETITYQLEGNLN